MSDALSRATLRAEAMAARGSRQPRETARDRLWTAVWSLVGAEVLTLAVIAGSVIYDEDHDNGREAARQAAALDLLVVSCYAVQDREVQPPACLRPEVQEALDELAP